MSTRYTRKSLEYLVNYANETVPPCNGCHFKCTLTALAARFVSLPYPVARGSVKYNGVYTPREAAERFC